MQASPIAHSSEDGRTHDLLEHLCAVGEQASLAAARFGAGDWARLAGHWHDLGKYSSAFQSYIGRGDARTAPDRHLEAGGGRVDHSTAGAVLAVRKFGMYGNLLAYAIAGHHAGLADWITDAPNGPSPLSARLTKQQLLDDALAGSPAGAPPAALVPATMPTEKLHGRDPAFWIRMIFSALVDGDFLDTEAFFDTSRARARTGYPPLADLAPLLEARLSAFDSAPDTPVNRARREVLGASRVAAAGAPGVFSLSVPTGGGKTLASLAFAIDHALRHSKRRIIYVIPYTSIIEQTGQLFRDIFAAAGDVVLEHHSTFDAKLETGRGRLAAENWDAPLIVTTNVQFFESLHANRPSRCRKLHNITDSVIVLDEAHLLSPDFLVPCLFALKQLTVHYGCTVLLASATPPALDPRAGFEGLPNRVEIVPDPEELSRRMVRVTVEMPDDLQTPMAWEALAREVTNEKQVLCIVDRRQDARLLHGLLGDGAVHLSALMCPAHRTKVLGDIRRQLANGETCRVVSTQLVEAGVDIDFPVVFRALAGLDSIAQAAGRCNREGKLTKLGRVKVFVSPNDPPAGLLRQARDVTKLLMARDPASPLLSLHRFEAFFRELYWTRGDRLDAKKIRTALAVNLQLQFRFATAAAAFQLIPDNDLPVVVPYGEGPAVLSRLRAAGPSRDVYRALQRHIVAIPRRLHAAMVAAGAVAEEANAPGVFALQRADLYDAATGLIADPTRPQAVEDLIV